MLQYAEVKALHSSAIICAWSMHSATYLPLGNSDGQERPDDLADLLDRLFTIISGSLGENIEIRDPRFDVEETCCLLR